MKDLLGKERPWWGGKAINLCCAHNAPYAIFGQHKIRGYRAPHARASEAKDADDMVGNLDAFVDWCGVPLVGADTTACTTGSAKQLQRPTMRRDETNQTAYDGLSKIETMLALPDHTAGLLQCNESIVCSHEHHGIDID